MSDILFLCQRLPFPPNKGEKIRAFQLLRHLAERHRVVLGCFVDDPQDWSQVEALRPYCAAMNILPLRSRRALVRSAAGFVDGGALSVAYFRDRRMASWVRGMVAKRRPEAAVIYSSAMAQYVPRGNSNLKSLVIDFVDVDSDKWRQYAATKSWPLSWVYAREARKLLAFDRHWAARARAATFVSEAEASLFRALAPECAAKVKVVANGVDSSYFAPDAVPAPPARKHRPMVVFTGTMNYWPNEDAVSWFVAESLPPLRRTHPNLGFYIVGAKPSRRVAALATVDGVVVTGAVDDVRPYLTGADVVVAPMRVARGVQNKVLEAMAMGKAVVTTPQGLEGIAATAGQHLLVAETAGDFVQATTAALDPALAKRLGEAARRRVVEAYSWPAQLQSFDRLLGL